MVKKKKKEGKRKGRKKGEKGRKSPPPQGMGRYFPFFFPRGGGGGVGRGVK